ncbi:MAG TPA: cobalt transporter CbiM [Bryobacteraceae bacterium]|nr:cobalt transporter CbiM [Bryobacteraceae bacterium]
MHIPDGYLSPSTCVALFGAAAPFWWTALDRVKRTLHTRAIPLLSVFAAFSFVVMMFNLPLPGGTTGHAVGMGVASIVLGPWASIVAISVALAIQAVFFGDGGITAIGANCFNMAIVGSLTAYWIYRVLGQRAAIGAARRVFAAGLAGYAAINMAALCAAIEFGIQPALFHDASGAPLYAPYSLAISIPAMMIGHLTFAGLAELVISSGLVAWLQRVDPSLLALTAPDAPDRDAPAVSPTSSGTWPAAWKLWLVVGVLVLLTPLGILAVGTAWGEWSVQDFAHAPPGLARLSALWSAPLARYAPSFIGHAWLGYFLSGVVGVGVIVMLGLLARWSIRARRRQNFIERTLRSLLEVLQRELFAEQTAVAPGLLQRLDARVKLVGILLLIIPAIAVHRLAILGALLALCVVLALASRIGVGVLAAKTWLAVLLFTGAIAAPAIFLTPGDAAFRAPVLGWVATDQGLRAAAFLILRAMSSATLAALLVLCTPWAQLLRALRWFRVPAVLVAIVGMTYRYIFLFVQVAREMFEAREARLIGDLEPRDRRRLAAGSAGLLLSKSLQLSGEVHLAMQARGFRGDVRLLDDPALASRDWLALTAFAALACVVLWFGR